MYAFDIIGICIQGINNSHVDIHGWSGIRSLYDWTVSIIQPINTSSKIIHVARETYLRLFRGKKLELRINSWAEIYFFQICLVTYLTQYAHLPSRL